MKNVFNIALLMAAVCVPLAVKADDVHLSIEKSPAKPSIVIIESNRIVMETEEGKEIRTRIEAIDKKYSEQLEKLKKEIQDDAASYETKKRTASKDALKDFEEQFVEKQEKYNRLTQRAQSELNEKGGEEINNFDKKVRGVVGDWAKKNDYDVVLLKESGVYYSSDRVDKTADVIKLLNDSYKPANKPAKAVTKAQVAKAA